jgi:DNA replication licensing factor MCM7
VNRIEGNTMHFISMFSDAIDQLLPLPTVELPTDDVLDVLLAHRKAQREAAAQAGDAQQDRNHGLPPDLMRRFEVYIVPTSKTAQKQRAVRAVRAEDIGHLVAVRGMVTRVTDVRPLVSVATYTCEVCGNEVFQTVTAPTFMPLDACPSERCKTNRDHGRLVLQTRGSRFQRTQEMRLQELPDQVPVGHIPRSMTVTLRGVHTRVLLPGDLISVSGVFLPRPVQQQRHAPSSIGLLADTYLETMSIEQHKQRASREHVRWCFFSHFVI